MFKHIGLGAAAVIALVAFAAPASADPPWARGRGFDHNRGWEHRGPGRHWSRHERRERHWAHERERRGYGSPRYGAYAPAPGVFIPFR